MSDYKTIQTKNPFIEHIGPTQGFFERYCIQLRDMNKTGLDFNTIWHQFCGINNIVAQKPWCIADEELKNLNELTDHEIYVLIGEAIGRFWKGEYKGEGF